MKKQSIIDLINAHYKKNEIEFLKICKRITQDLNDIKEHNLADEIQKIIRKNTIVEVEKI